MPNFYNLINTIRAENSELYQERIPEVTFTNMADVGVMITSHDYEPQKNEFLNALVYKVAFTDVINRRWKNPLAVLKKGTRPYGGIKEVAHTNPVKGKQFNPEGGATELLGTDKPDVKTAYFQRNRQQMYPVSISDSQLRNAFRSPAEFGKLYESIINAMYSGDEMDEYCLMRDGLSDCISNGRVVSHEIDYEANPADLIKAINTFSRYFKYESDKYAGYNLINAAKITAGEAPCITWCPTDRQVLLIREDVDVNTDIEVLAKAFNMDKTDFATRKIGIDTFKDPSILCVLADESFFEFEDEEYKVKNFENGANLTTKYFLHHWETIGYNGLANCVAFKQKATTEG